jgi:predicted cupin superfamily sugar epimerase
MIDRAAALIATLGLSPHPESYSLVGCPVGPGFDFHDFALAGEQSAIESVIRARDPVLAELF